MARGKLSKKLFNHFTTLPIDCRKYSIWYHKIKFFKGSHFQYHLILPLLFYLAGWVNLIESCSCSVLHFVYWGENWAHLLCILVHIYTTVIDMLGCTVELPHRDAQLEFIVSTQNRNKGLFLYIFNVWKNRTTPSMPRNLLGS